MLVMLVRSLVNLCNGKMTRGVTEWIDKLFSGRHIFWAVYALLVLFCISSANCHPVHDGMTEAESRILCWKALLSGPYAGHFLPCVPNWMKEVGVECVVIPMLFLLSAVVLATSRKRKLALYSFAAFVLIWFFMAMGALWYWK